MPDDVEDAVIRPMTDMFPPPTHLRGNPRAIQTALDVYRRALAGFSRPVLERAFQLVASENEYCAWPKLPYLVQACASREKRAAPPADDWVEKATALTDAYVKRFMLASQVAVRAREGGYERELKEYVREAAWVQSQYVVGRKGVGYSSVVLFKFGEDQEAREEFFARAREQAEKGHVRVHVPARMVERWKGQAAGRER